MADVQVTLPRDDYNPNQRTSIDVAVVNPDGSTSTRTVKGAVQSTTEEDGTVTFGIMASAHVPFGGGGTYEDEVLADSPLGYWRLGESSGSTATDSSGNGRDMGATLQWGYTGLLAGDSDTCAFANGHFADYTANDAWLNVTNLTVEAWIKPSTVSGNRTILARFANTGGTDTQVFTFRTDGNKLALYLFDGSSFTSAVGSTTLSTGTTYHVVGTYDGSTIKVYVNGSEDGSTSYSTALNSNTRDLTIGTKAEGAEWWNGYLDEVAYYGSALSSTRIAAHYSAGAA